jgi:hypothetical protein
MSEMLKIDLPVKEIHAYCETQPILRLSELAPEFEGWLRPNTEIGFLVDYVPGAIVTLLDMAGHEIDLEEIIGKGVSLQTSKGLSRGSLDKYIKSARLIYDKETGE